MLLDQHPLIINFRGQTPNKSERWCWMLKTTVAKQMNNFTALPLPPFLFWGDLKFVWSQLSMLMSDASLFLKLIIVGLDKIESGFGRKLHTRVIELIIVVKLSSLTRWPLLHHHFSDTTKSIWFLRSERCLLLFSFGPRRFGGDLHLLTLTAKNRFYAQFFFCLLFHPTF